ncbi:MAG: rhodanese-like domain-containing protein [Spirochaetia bacterium]|jgi:rhodanese-related sulfurtransferase
MKALWHGRGFRESVASKPWFKGECQEVHMRNSINIATILLVLLLIVPPAAIAERGTQVSIEEGTYRSVSATELSEMLVSKDFFLVNVHVPYAGEIPGTDALISYLDTEKRLGDYPHDKDSKIVIYCMTNRMSGIVVRQLLKDGFKNIYMLDGGMTAWKAAGFRLVNPG